MKTLKINKQKLNQIIEQLQTFPTPDVPVVNQLKIAVKKISGLNGLPLTNLNNAITLLIATAIDHPLSKSDLARFENFLEKNFHSGKKDTGDKMAKFNKHLHPSSFKFSS